MGEEMMSQRARIHPELGPLTGLSVVPDRVLASWRRSEEYGVSLESVDPVFAGSYDQESLFFECGQEVLSQLHATLINEPVSLMLTDANGLVLNRLSGDRSLLCALDAVHLAPGFAFSEREAGTNGLGLALADRIPALVRAEEHYSVSLCGYTCAAVPVLDPLTGRLEGSVNLTTWSRSSSDLLLALAQSAAGNTAALMLARARGRTSRPAPRGQVFRVERPRSTSDTVPTPTLSRVWTDALDLASTALSSGRVVAVIGQVGSGRSTLATQALRRVHPRDRILSARAPQPQDVGAWLDLWGPELAKPATSVVVCDVDTLPASAARRLHELVQGAREQVAPGAPGAAQGPSVVLTASELDDLPNALRPLADAVVPLPSLRERPDDVLEIAGQVAERVRGRAVTFTPAAARALRDYSWPGNAEELARVVRSAAAKSEKVDVHHLPPAVFSSSAHRLTRLELVERDEIIRCVTRPGATVKEAAQELGMSRATIYRKLAHYGIQIPRNAKGTGRT